MEKMKIEIQNALKYQQTEILTSNQTLNLESEQIQKSYSEKKEFLAKQEATYYNLESELESIQIQNQQVIVSSSSSLPIESITKRKLFVKIKNKGSISIKCSPDGTFISLFNQSINEHINISKWIIKRNLDSNFEYQYTLPDQVLFEAGRELRIYAKQGVQCNEIPLFGRCILSSLRQEFINNDIGSWGMSY
ncbi:unnamed protein product [Adineta ricciae]|uniref:LTD domain-containing protein n=1 Tax=Adineta ricciae TaxID=249248 RepID=A0A815U171_ADIRI|nr:unnamed protein product [Adineta ricciae]CAF1581142.1 unnamed protein product [Adineta ricciae]